MTNPPSLSTARILSLEGYILCLGLCKTSATVHRLFIAQTVAKMKQKIVIKVDMRCQKCRSKAMEIAAVACGVISVAIEGKEQDQVVVIGDGVDSACLVKRLRKKVGYAVLVTVEEVKPPEKPEEEKPTCQPPTCQPPTCQPPTCQPQCHVYPYFVRYETVDEPNPSICSIM